MSQLIERDPVRRVRAFNRAVSERIGALNDRFLARDRPLGEARVLWEIGEKGVDVRTLRARLGLDSGYLSRLLRALEDAELAVVVHAERDRRVRRVELTEAGRAERAVLDRLSDDVAWSFLEPLNESQRTRLLDAMDAVRSLLTAGLVEVSITEPTSPDARHCLDAYVHELAERFDTGFDPGRSISAEPEELSEPAGLLLVARLRGQPIGCGALKLHGKEPAEIKRMWVDRGTRGLGLGRRILSELERAAADRGVTTLRLETNETLDEAIGLYRRAGYEEVPAFNDEPYAHHWFEKRLAGTRGPGRTDSDRPGSLA